MEQFHFSMEYEKLNMLFTANLCILRIKQKDCLV